MVCAEIVRKWADAVMAPPFCVAEVSLGRRSRLREVESALLRELRVDGDLIRSCRAVGVGRRTVYEWLNRGKDAERAEFAAFRQAYREAILAGSMARHRDKEMPAAGISPVKERISLGSYFDRVVARRAMT
jgi:hypothetical protein